MINDSILCGRRWIPCRDFFLTDSKVYSRSQRTLPIVAGGANGWLTTQRESLILGTPQTMKNVFALLLLLPRTEFVRRRIVHGVDHSCVVNLTVILYLSLRVRQLQLYSYESKKRPRRYPTSQITANHLSDDDSSACKKSL